MSPPVISPIANNIHNEPSVPKQYAPKKKRPVSIRLRARELYIPPRARSTACISEDPV